MSCFSLSISLRSERANCALISHGTSTLEFWFYEGLYELPSLLPFDLFYSSDDAFCHNASVTIFNQFSIYILSFFFLWEQIPGYVIELRFSFLIYIFIWNIILLYVTFHISRVAIFLSFSCTRASVNPREHSTLSRCTENRKRKRKKKRGKWIAN